jgi:hypothetical protein
MTGQTHQSLLAENRSPPALPRLPGVVTKGLEADGLSGVAAANPWALRVGGAGTC